MPGSIGRKRYAGKGSDCSARERSLPVRLASGSRASRKSAYGCAKPWTRWGREAQRLRADAFMEARRRVERQQSEAGADPVDLPAWESLRACADELRGEPGLAPEVKEAVDAVLARDARIEVEIAPIKTFLDEGVRHLERRAKLEEEARELGGELSGLDAMPAW